MARKKKITTSERKIGRSAFGLRAPIIKEGDSLCDIVASVVLDSGLPIDDRDILCITESVVARSSGLYATVDEIAQDVRMKYIDENGKLDHLVLWYPVFSRNRFSVCLRGIAKAMDPGSTIYIVFGETDEVGNKVLNQVTGVNILPYYSKICQEYGVEVEFEDTGKYLNLRSASSMTRFTNHLICPVRETEEIDEGIYDLRVEAEMDGVGYNCYNLGNILSDTSEWGLYGSNKAAENKIKLFPSIKDCQMLSNQVQTMILEKTGKQIEVGVYGDGGFKDPDSGIWEELDPVIMIAYTEGLCGMPSEVKIKNLADDKYKDLEGEELKMALKKEAKEAGDTSGKMISQGCTPRKVYNLVGSLADLISGSGSQGCPFVYIKGYFDNYGDD